MHFCASVETFIDVLQKMRCATWNKLAWKVIPPPPNILRKRKTINFKSTNPWHWRWTIECHFRLSISAHSGTAFCLLGICFTGCDQTLTITLLTVGVTLQGALYSGFFTNPLDIACNYSGTILGITNAVGTIPGWLAPLVAGAFTKAGVNKMHTYKFFEPLKNGAQLWIFFFVFFLGPLTVTDSDTRIS